MVILDRESLQDLQLNKNLIIKTIKDLQLSKDFTCKSFFFLLCLLQLKYNKYDHKDNKDFKDNIKHG